MANATAGDQRVNTYRDMPNSLQYILEYGNTNVLNLLAGTFGSAVTSSGINMSPVTIQTAKLPSPPNPANTCPEPPRYL